MTDLLQQKQAALRVAESRVRQRREETAKAQRAQSVAEKDVARLKTEIAAIPTTPVSSRKLVLSEHAKLRYLERVVGWDVEGAIRKIDTSAAEAALAAGITAGRFHLPGGQALVMTNGVIVTVRP